MNKRNLTRVRMALAAALLGFAPLAGAPAKAETPRQSQYAPYQFLIGEWDLSPESGGPPAGIVQFKWGPNQSYIWFAVSLLESGAARPHIEGMLMWNGVHKNLDMLLAGDLNRGLMQEQGTLTAKPDGTVVREIVAVYSAGVPLPPRGETTVAPAGATAKFRQDFKPLAADKILTNALRWDGQTWAPTFPGSDHLLMARRKPS